MRQTSRLRVLKAVAGVLAGALLMLSAFYAVNFQRSYGTLNFSAPPQRLIYRERGFVLIESRGPVDSRSMTLKTLEDNAWPLPDLLDDTGPGSDAFLIYVRTWDGRLWALEEVGVA